MWLILGGGEHTTQEYIIKSSIQKGIKTALEKQSDTISFVKAFANDTTLEDNIADVVVCSQSFHWMEPAETLAEINRILKKGGIFAAIDCDWPPVCNRQAEEAYNQLSEKVTELSVVCKENDSYHWDKDKHLYNIRKSGYFSYCGEIVFCNREKCSSKRFIELAKSQGGLQAILKIAPEKIEPYIKKFEDIISNVLKDTFWLDFCYRMRIGIK